MKKLMIAAAIVCAAVASQAATCVWNATQSFDTYIYTAGSDYGTEYSGNMYLIAVATASQSTLLNDLRTGGSLDNYTKAATIAVEDGVFSATKFNTDGTVGTQYAFYAVIQDGDNVFISDSVAGKATDMTDGTALNYDLDYQSGDNGTVFGSAAYTSGGWYQTVPEPTSGLLLLLGMAGLALRRRRA